MSIDTEVTEAWIKLHIDGFKKDAVYYIERDTARIFSGKLDKADTLIHDSGLEPCATYTYQAYAVKNGDRSEAETETVTTMDTISHDFHWIRYDFGVSQGKRNQFT